MKPPRSLSCTLALLALLGLPPSQAAAAGSCTGTYFSRIVVVVFENTDYADVAKKMPFFTSLGAQGAALLNYHGLTHPSQGNYIGLISGQTRVPQGDAGDDPINLSGRHLGDLLEASGKDWRVYAEQYPESCSLDEGDGGYARKHAPFLSFTNVQRDSNRCGKVVNARRFDADVAAARLPEFVLYVPDLKNDGHDTSPAYADNWFRSRFAGFLRDQASMPCTLLVATFDEAEDDADGTNHIAAVFSGAMVRPGARITDRVNHYSLLKLIEENWPSLGNLGAGDRSAASIRGWNR